MTGWLAIAGLGPGDEALVTAEVHAALAEATDIVGYIPYVARVAPRAGLTLHAIRQPGGAGPRRATRCDMAAAGRRVVVVSSGDPGVFAMASAVFEALEARADPDAFDIRVLPGITAMLAAAARLGAPLGHDFCAINLSRQSQALGADRKASARWPPRPISRWPSTTPAPNPARTNSPARWRSCARTAGRRRLISFARAVTTPEERLTTVTLAEATPEMADMRTVVIVGNPRHAARRALRLYPEVARDDPASAITSATVAATCRSGQRRAGRS